MSEANRLRLLYFLVFCCTAAWLPIMADYLRDQGLSGFQSAIILAVTPFMMLLFQPLYGSVADRVGYRKCLLLSSFLASASYLGYLVNGSFVWLFIITVLMSFFYNGVQPVLDSMSLQLAKTNEKFSYGKLRIAGAAGWAVTSLVTGQLIDAIDTTVIFSVAAVSMFIAFIIALWLKSHPVVITHTGNQSFSNLREVLRSRSLIILLFAVFLVSAGTSPIWYFYSTYLKENGGSASLVGVGLFLQGICELPLFYFSAVIIRKLGLKRTLTITIAACFIRLLLYAFIRNPYAALPIELLHGISWSLFWVACVEYVNGLVKEQWRVTGQSLLYAAYYGAGIIAGNFWTGYLADSKLRIADIFYLNAGILLATTLLVVLFIRNQKLSGPGAVTGVA